MEKSDFHKLITNLLKASDSIDYFYELGIDLFELKDSPLSPLFENMDMLLHAVFGEESVDLINSFCYEIGRDIRSAEEIEDLYNIVMKYQQ